MYAFICLYFVRYYTGRLPYIALHELTQINKPPGFEDYGYVLVIKDDFSTLTCLWPCREVSALAAADGILHCFATFGKAPFWLSDQGTHFQNALLQEVHHRLRVENHFVSV